MENFNFFHNDSTEENQIKEERTNNIIDFNKG